MPQTSQTASDTGPTVAEAITKLEHEWASAVKASDSAKAMSLLSEIFIDMDSQGSLHNKSEVLDWIQHSRWQVCEISNVKVVVHGDTALATGIWRGKGTSPDGKPVDAHERWLDTWLKNGKWQCVASASTSVKA
jgi:ketosteroid isomerase-like protein